MVRLFALWRLVRKHKRTSRFWQEEALRLRSRVDALGRELAARQRVNAQPAATARTAASIDEPEVIDEDLLTDMQAAALSEYRKQARENGWPQQFGDQMYLRALRDGFIQ